jgi:hypothetical protein
LLSFNINSSTFDTVLLLHSCQLQLDRHARTVSIWHTDLGLYRCRVARQVNLLNLEVPALFRRFGVRIQILEVLPRR